MEERVRLWRLITKKKKKEKFNSWKGPTQGLGEYSLSAEKMYSINFTKANAKFCLSFHYDGANSYLFVNGTEIYKFKAKDSEIVPNNLCLGNVSKDFSASNMKKLDLMIISTTLVLIIMQLTFMIF